MKEHSIWQPLLKITKIWHTLENGLKIKKDLKFNQLLNHLILSGKIDTTQIKREPKRQCLSLV